jgi:hypothetical protein
MVTTKATFIMSCSNICRCRIIVYCFNGRVGSYRIYADLDMQLIKDAKQLYLGDDELEVQLKGNVFAIDSTTIDLCLSTFYWATFRSTKGGIKLHTQIDLKTSIPEFILFSNASCHDVNVLDVVSFEANSFYIMYRGYVDYQRLYRIDQCNAIFVTRAKDNMNYRRLYSHPKDKTNGVLYDQTITAKQSLCIKGLS